MFLEPTTLAELLSEMKVYRPMRLWHPQLLKPKNRTTIQRTMRFMRFSLLGGFVPEYRNWDEHVVFIVDLAETITCPVGCVYCYVSVQVGGKADSEFFIEEKDLPQLILALHQFADFRYEVFGRKTNLLIGQKVETLADHKVLKLTHTFLTGLLVNKNINVLIYTKLPKPKFVSKFEKFRAGGQLGWLVSLTNLLDIEGLEPGADPYGERVAQVLRMQKEGWPVIPYFVFIDPCEASMAAETIPIFKSNVVLASTLRFFDKEQGQAEATEKVLKEWYQNMGSYNAVVRHRLTTDKIKRIDSILHEASVRHNKVILLDRSSVSGNVPWQTPTVRSDKPCANGNDVKPCHYAQKRLFCDATHCKTIKEHGDAWLQRSLGDLARELRMVHIVKDGLIAAEQRKLACHS